MTITVMRDAIVCPRCGTERQVTSRQKRRARQEGGIICAPCRGFGSTRGFSENDLRFWLRRFGTPCPPGTPARQFIVAGGASEELVDLAKSIYG